MGFFDTLKSFAPSIGGIVSSLAPAAGEFLGNKLGGAQGAAFGRSLGGMAGKAAKSFTAPRPQPGQLPGQSPEMMQGPEGQGAPGQSFGQAGANAAASFIPEQYRNQSFGQMAQGLQGQGANYLNNMFGQNSGMGEAIMGGLGNLGGAFGNYLGNRFGSQMPAGMNWQNMMNMTPAGAAQQMGNTADQYIQQGMNMIPGYSGQGGQGGQGYGAQGGYGQQQMAPQGYAGGGNVTAALSGHPTMGVNLARMQPMPWAGRMPAPRMGMAAMPQRHFNLREIGEMMPAPMPLVG